MRACERRLLNLSCALALICNSVSVVVADDPFASAIRPTNPLTPEEELTALHVPPGFRVQLFASEPEIQKPINMAFDGRGRLWVSGTEDYPFPNLKEPGDSIRILEDTDRDGRADHITTFVDQITHPMGLLPDRDGVIAYCIPNIWFFHDTDGDGRCDQRELLYGPFDYSRDTHGMVNAFRRGFDGWIYACHGFSNHSVVTGKDGHTVDMSSGNTFRFRPDGSRIEQFTFGQINPFGMTFDARGDLFDSDCHTKPLTLLLREGQYQGFGRKHDGLGFVPEVMHHSHGSTAIAGAAQASDERFPPEFRDNFFEGNVMTSRVNRDTLAYSGSSMTAVEQPDFLISDDPWFRPVDLQLGADGALYIADFYNKIIGHYEVSLIHPERDRHRGRIWRVEYVGTEGSAQPAPQVNLATASLQELVQAAGSRNVPHRIKAIDEIADRLGAAVAPDLLKSLTDTQDETTRISLLWALQRLQALPASALLQAAGTESPLVRTHAQRILAASPDWSEELRTAALAGLNDSDPFVRRAAADALAAHPHLRQVEPLMVCWRQSSLQDPMLRYQLKVALRDQLQVPGVLPRLQASGLSLEDRSMLAEVCLGVDTRETASFLLSVLSDPMFIPEQPEQLVERLSKWASREEQQQLIQTIQSRSSQDLEMQLKLLQVMRQGLRHQGIESSDLIQDWATSLVQRIFALRNQPQSWTVNSIPPTAASSWDFEPRSSADGQTSGPFFSSLPGGEKAISTLRSPDFVIPPSLTFFVCGHLGFPGHEAQPVNFVHLCLAENDQEIARALPPRNDVAQPVTWDLKAFAGKQGYLEVVDGLELAAYAWIAIGRIEPPVAPLPSTSAAAERRLLIAASMLAGELNLRGFSDELAAILKDRQLGADVRGSAADAISKFQGSPLAAGLAALYKVPSLTAEQLASVEPGLLEDLPVENRLKLFGDVCRTIATRHQVEVAQAILSRDGGAALLLQLCEAEALSPRVLASSVIRPQLEASRNPEFIQRMTAMLGKLPPVSAERDERIKKLSKGFTLQLPDAAAGRKVFESRCAACHQVKGVGKVIGPQLDGIGSRGAERLFEDVIDPNRNVDHAFRSRTYALSDGKIYSGIFRRQDGPLTIIADNKGEEHSFASDQIEEQAVSNVSIMPDNWVEIIPETDLYALMSYLLEQKK